MAIKKITNKFYLLQKINTWCNNFHKGELEPYEIYYQVVFRQLLDNYGLLLTTAKSNKWKTVKTHTFTLYKIPKEIRDKLDNPDLTAVFYLAFPLIGIKTPDYDDVKIVKETESSITIRAYMKL